MLLFKAALELRQDIIKQLRINGLAQESISGNMVVVKFELATFWPVARSHNHKATTTFYLLTSICLLF